MDDKQKLRAYKRTEITAAAVNVDKKVAAALRAEREQWYRKMLLSLQRGPFTLEEARSLCEAAEASRLREEAGDRSRNSDEEAS